MAENDNQEPAGVGRRPDRAEQPQPQRAAPTLEQLAARALATQGKPQTLVQALSEEQQQAIAATLGEDGLATEQTAEAVRLAINEVYERSKATDGDLEA